MAKNNNYSSDISYYNTVNTNYKLSIPAMDHNGFAFSPHLNFGHLLNDICHSSQVGTAAVRTPVCDVELFHPATLTTLRTRSK